MVGQVHTLGDPYPEEQGAWILEDARIGCTLVAWLESQMRLLDNPGDDAVDESLSWLPVPTTQREKETA